MSTLGIGVRVYVNYSADIFGGGLVCQTGTIITGPFMPGADLPEVKENIGLSETGWLVNTDDGESGYIIERLLTPIDPDPDPQAVERRETACET